MDKELTSKAGFPSSAQHFCDISKTKFGLDLCSNGDDMRECA